MSHVLLLLAFFVAHVTTASCNMIEHLEIRSASSATTALQPQFGLLPAIENTFVSHWRRGKLSISA